MPDKYGRSGMMTITLSGADGRVVGGLVSGLTVAASPVKVHLHFSLSLSDCHCMITWKAINVLSISLSLS